MKKGILFALCLVVLGISLLIVYGCGTGGGGGGTPVPPFAAEVWVSTTGSDEAGDGSFNNPYRTIMKGLSEAGTGETVGIKNGTYTESIVWLPTFEARTLRGQSRAGTILEPPGGSGRVMFFDCLPPSVIGATIESLSIKEGTADSSAGAAIWFSVPAVLNLRDLYFYHNVAGNGGTGGALYLSGGWIVAENCDFHWNASQMSGGAVFINSGIFEATECIFRGNYNYTYSTKGGAIYNENGIMRINKCSFHDNYGGGQGGAISSASTGEVVNSLFYNNESENYSAGAIYSTGEAVFSIMNCTIVSNEAASSAGAAVSVHTGAYVTNSIIWGSNPSGNEIVASTPGNVNYCDIGNAYGSGSGNISVAPYFNSFPATEDTDLRITGPAAVSAGGTTIGAPDDDFEGTLRDEGSHVSIGAFEYH